jgi:hypothetical protein
MLRPAVIVASERDAEAPDAAFENCAAPSGSRATTFDPAAQHSA